jgi:hypothetical protein
MARTSPAIKIIEIGGEQFEDLESAQQSARVMLAFDLAQIIKRTIETGTLEIKNGQIILKEKNDGY